MRILGIDPGLADCGWALVSTSARKPHCLASGTWQTEPAPDWRARVRGIVRLCAGIMRDIDLVCVEAYTFQGERSFSANAMRLPYLIGQLTGMAELRKIPCVEVTTQQAKVAVGLRPRSDKADVKRAIRVLLDGEWPTTTHARDAVAAAIAGERVYRSQNLRADVGASTRSISTENLVTESGGPDEL